MLTAEGTLPDRQKFVKVNPYPRVRAAWMVHVGAFPSHSAGDGGVDLVLSLAACVLQCDEDSGNSSASHRHALLLLGAVFSGCDAEGHHHRRCRRC